MKKIHINIYEGITLGEPLAHEKLCELATKI